MTQLRQGGSARQGGVTSDRKTMVRFSLTEGILKRARRQLADARCVALLRDERKGRLLVRYRATLNDWSTCSGVLGLKRTEGSADDLSKATEQILQEFCTPLTGLPRQALKPETTDELDPSELEAVIRRKVSVIASDAAAPELVSGQILRGRRREANPALACADIFPNVRIVARDAAHSSTRLLKRPLCHHEVLKGVTAEFVTSSESFAQKVQHSEVFKNWWREAITEKNDEGANDDDLFLSGVSISAAKHRFSSYALPLGRIARNAGAMVSVLQRVDAMRGALWAKQILRNINGRKLLLLALCADAAHTCLDFTRFTDDEGCDIAMLNCQAEKLAKTIHSLFVDGRALTLPTHTKEMVELLARGHVTVMLDGCAREIYITDADKQWGLETMREWAAAAQVTLEAEFPCWHLLSCFSIFNLESRRSSDLDVAMKKSLEKLAKAFKVNAARLQRQFSLLLPVAESLHNDGCFKNRMAWKEAMVRSHATSKTRARFEAESDELQQAGPCLS